MKRRTYPYLLADFYDTSKFQMINFAIVKIEHFNSDPMISLFENMQITSIYGCFSDMTKYLFLKTTLMNLNNFSIKHWSNV